MQKYILAIILAGVNVNSAFAYTYATQANMATIQSIRVQVNDRVSDNCLLNASAIKASVESNLSRSGIVVRDDGQYTLYFDFLGFGTTDRRKNPTGCVVGVNLTLYNFAPAWGPLALAERSNVMVGPSALDSDALSDADAFTNEIITGILQGRLAVSKQQ